MPTFTPIPVTVYQDDREQRPLLFPPRLHATTIYDEKITLNVKVLKTRLVAGDYSIVRTDIPNGWAPGIERKGSWDELNQNLLTKDLERFRKALAHLREAYNPIYLFMGVPIVSLDTIPDAPRVLDRLNCELYKVGITPHFVWLGACKTMSSRRAAGHFALRLLLPWVLKSKGQHS